MRFVEVTSSLRVVDGWPTASEHGRGYVLLPGISSPPAEGKAYQTTKIWFSESPPEVGEKGRIYRGNVYKQGWRHFISEGEGDDERFCVLFSFTGEFKRLQDRTAEPYTIRFADLSGKESPGMAGNFYTFAGEDHWVKLENFRTNQVHYVLILNGEIRVVSEDFGSLTIGKRYDAGKIYSSTMI